MPSLSPNQLNPEERIDQENDTNTTEQKTQHLSRLQNEIGSKVLSLVNFESKYKNIVESSFNKARNNKEKLPGKNNERRNFAYLSRLDRMIEKHGDALEQKLWKASAENLVMDYEDIPEAYWKQQEQILRDNGQGRELSEYEKEILAEDLIDKQRQSITSWANYLGDKNCPYPTWFKVYAFDGISKMSNALNLDDADYNRRDNTTALSFPKLNAEILAKVYRQINDFYGVDKENWLAQHSDDEKLVSLVKSANFPKLYAKELVDTKVILKTPERTEDVHGDWFEYKLGDEEEIASLAEGTRWCVVDPNVAHNYLVYGQYSNPEEDDDYDQDYEDDEDWEDDDYEDDDYDDDDQAETYEHDDVEVENPEAKFIIFRLEDPNSPGVFASNGSASIRLDPDGIVDEVSGLNDGQAVEDALVPIVKEKALSLPGGEKYLQKFDDKQTLIKLDNKMEAGEDLTKEELSFLYELDRPIATLDTYNREDPRIPELKEKYGIEYAVEKGVDANKLVSSLGSKDITKNLEPLLRNSADVDNIVKNMDSKDINTNLDAFLKYHADIDLVVGRMEPRDIVYKLDFLFDHGANIDVNELVSKLGSYDILQNLDTLLKNGADIDVDQMRYRFSYYAHFNLDDLLRRGADINKVVNYMNSNYIAADLEYLYKNGADINNIVKNMDPNDIVWKLDYLNKNGANIDVNELVSKLDSTYVFRRMDFLLSHGADIDIIVKNMDPKNIARNLDYLNKNGANIDINQLVSNLRQEDITKNKNLNILLQHGADVNLITEKLSKKDIEDNIDLLREYGAKLDTYQENN
ncbi:hypothetical protein [Candidatus Nanosyncoccus nanoralicus]|uniref:Ankyrin repeat domain-containing protein n=1 Tax=Candidatus Nanosyncoccus nanoralicus TaxID=2171996 RepID=A0ABY0FJQ0_9BACT|nr:hypothetical protein [Candidatus Nanosyncoccus nanoralicus]RYC73373.1 hypothetical protein G3KMM_00419 [Candidatus Nanosyncoccus nanoralicus]